MTVPLMILTHCLTINGDGTGSERDYLSVDDTADDVDNTGVLTSARITGLGMGNVNQQVVEAALGITYGTIEDLYIALGTGNDHFTIDSTHNGSTGGTTELPGCLPVPAPIPLILMMSVTP